MKPFKFVLPCVLVLFAVAPALAGSRLACAELNDAYNMSPFVGSYTWYQERAQMKAAGRCFDISGKTVTVHRTGLNFKSPDVFSCIRAHGKGGPCFWAR
jgi:hypothetical protein